MLLEPGTGSEFPGSEIETATLSRLLPESAFLEPRTGIETTSSLEPILGAAVLGLEPITGMGMETGLLSSVSVDGDCVC